MNAAKLLRQKILDLAIRGKLTNREKGDEPAAELLARIAAEKQKLIAAKKIKKEKPLPPITEDEKPFDLPMGWEWSRLKEITDSRLLNDGDWILSDDMVEEGPVKLLQLGSVGDGVYRNKGFKYLTEERFRNLGCTLIHEGYLLINRMIGDSLLACLMPKIDGKVITAVDICWVSPSERYDVKFLMYVVLSPYFQKAANDLGAGEGRVRVSKGNLTQISIPLPPLAEQHRIVSRVEELLAEVDKYSAAMDTLASSSEMMEKKVLDLAIRGKLTKREKGDEPAAELLARIAEEKQKLVAAKKIKKEKPLPPITEDEKPFDIPEGWEWCRLGCLVEIVSGVSYQKGDIRPDGIRILRGGNLKEDNRLYLNGDDVFISKSYANEENAVRKDDIVVVASTGSATVIGRPAIAEADMPGVQIGAFLRIVRSRKKELAKWLQLAFRSDFYRRHIRECSKGTNINNLKNEYMTEFCIPIPPLAEQHRIVARVDELLAECRKMRGV